MSINESNMTERLQNSQNICFITKQDYLKSTQESNMTEGLERPHMFNVFTWNEETLHFCMRNNNKQGHVLQMNIHTDDQQQFRINVCVKQHNYSLFLIRLQQVYLKDNKKKRKHIFYKQQ